jgi:PilZ domain-containing protein
MGFADWLRQFRALHEKAKAGALMGADLSAYRSGRDELARALLAAQRMALPSGVRPRQALRVPRALQADLQFPDGDVRAMTVDVSAGGFAALMAKPPKVGEELKVALRIPGGEPLRSDARVIEVRAQVGNARASFQLVGLEEADAERLELLVFDAVLAQLQG